MVWVETWDVKRVIDLLQPWCKPAALNYSRMTLKIAMVLALATVRRSLDWDLLRITPKAMQVTTDLVTFQPVFWAKNAQLSHPYGPMIILMRSEDDCLCPVALIGEYLARTKNKRQRNEKLFVTGKEVQ